MAKFMVVLSDDEIRSKINYALICETMYGSRWNTGTVKKRWLSEFTPSERAACSKLKFLSHSWHLTRGVPREFTMSVNTLALWKKLEHFCGSV